MAFFFNTANIFMAVRECLIPNRGNEAQEEVIADLNTCLEQLIQRSTDMEGRIDVYMKKAASHLKSSKKENTLSGKNRERSRAKMYMEDKRRVQAEYDKTQRSIHMLQQQIDCIISSHTDMVIVDTMRQFNATASRLSLPHKTKEIEGLGEELNERKEEICVFQDAMQEMSSALGGIENNGEMDQDTLLMQELEDYINNQEDTTTATATTANQKRVPSAKVEEEESFHPLALPSVPLHRFSSNVDDDNDEKYIDTVNSMAPKNKAEILINNDNDNIVMVGDGGGGSSRVKTAVSKDLFF
jgi:hypothetical protein